MKTIATILFLIIVTISTCFTQEIVSINLGDTVVLDGIITTAEWADADSLEIPCPSSQPIKVYFKHDGTHFLAAFVLSNIATNEYKIPEVLFDPNNDKGEIWHYDDWWFHVSAQDCEGVGEYDVWDDCAITQPDWWGVPNFGFGSAPPIDTIELKIPWWKLNLQTGDTIGFAFNFWISDDLRLYWPEGAEIASPATWATVIIAEDSSWAYLGQDPPGITPERFPPEELLGNEEWFWHGPPVFSPDGKELFMSRYYPGTNDMLVYGMEYTGQEWTTPAIPDFCFNYNANSPAFSYSGDTLFYVAFQPEAQVNYTIKNANGWSNPQNVSVPLPAQSYFGNAVSVAKNGNLYFELDGSGNLDLYLSEFVNGQNMEAENLGDLINSPENDFSAFIDPDEQYIIFASSRNGGYGYSDLYISAKTTNGDWSVAQNLGDVINSENDDFGPYITNDGNYFFFCTSKDDDVGYNPYWVDSEILDDFLLTTTQSHQKSRVELNSFPNPFNSIVLIKYSITIARHIKLTVSDMSGRIIKILVDNKQTEGNHEVFWDGTNDAGHVVPAGIYLCKLQTENRINTIKILHSKN